MTRSTMIGNFSLPSLADIVYGFSYMESFEGVQQFYGVFVLTKIPKCE